jgi:carboxyl-terminal processing protease
MKYMNFRITNIRLLFILFILSGFLTASGQDVQKQSIKFDRTLRLLENFYTDSVDLNIVTEKAIVEILSNLDPHSVYISKEEVEKMNEPLKGNFEGVGISFNIYQDTLIVLTTIQGGPSEKVGLRAGDRIVRVDGKDIAGIGLKNQDVFDLLRGKKGTRVDLNIKRKGEGEILEFTIIRDKIPIYSLDASYMLDKETAYVKLNRFSATTTDEFVEAVENLKSKNEVKNIILDLRGNGGGMLNAAIEISNYFLSSGQLVVYTEGLHSLKTEYKATSNGEFSDGKLAVLIDERSASASEIISGAIQDWDRGIVVGRRSFGKGLVQRQFMLTDGSMIRLTTAHYYTPAGRNIQKPYGNGVKDYRGDYVSRLKKGEYFNQDSITLPDSLKVKTLRTGRNVYGGGGIMPDIFVPMDTSVHDSYFNTLIRKNVLFPFVIGHIDRNRDEILKDYKKFDDFKDKYEVSDEIIEQLVEEGEKADVPKDERGLKFAGDLIKKQIRARISSDLYGRNTFFRILYEDDDEINKALEIFSDDDLYRKYLEPTSSE